MPSPWHNSIKTTPDDDDFALRDPSDFSPSSSPLFDDQNGGLDDRDPGRFSDFEASENRPFLASSSPDRAHDRPRRDSGRRGSDPRWARHAPGRRPSWHDRSALSTAIRWLSDLGLARWQVQSARAIVFTLAFLKFTMLCSGILIMMPMTRLLEDALCHQHFGTDLSEPIDEKECKVDEVQSKLAYLGGVGILIAAIVTLITTFPYSVLADKVGRKPAFVLAYIGTMLGCTWGPFVMWTSRHPNVYLVLIGPIFFFIGGGVPTAINIIFAMASDVSSDAERSHNFVILSIGAATSGLLAPLLSGFLMEKFNPWVPIGVVLALTPVIFVAMALLPETLRVQLKENETDDDDDDVDGADARDSLKDAQSKLGAVRMYLRLGARELKEGLKILKIRNIQLCIISFVVSQPLWASYATTLPQYISKYYGWTLAQMNYLMSPISVQHLILLAILPWVSARLIDQNGRYRMSVFNRDLFLTRVSFSFYALGALIQGLSGSIVLFLFGIFVGNFGSASGPVLRAVVTGCVDPSMTSRLFGMLSIMDMMGAFIGGPVLAWLFSTGMEKGGILKGLPWFYVAFLCALAVAGQMFVREPRKQKHPVSVEDGDGLGYESAPEDN